MKSIFVFLVGLFLISCTENKMNSHEKLKHFINSETQKWKHQLIANGEVGTPCEENYMHWITNNPESYYGMPSQINASIYDANKDGKPDVLLYFPAGEACTGGHEEGSDFIKLIYSYGKEYLDNDNLRTKIAAKIEGEYFAKTNTDVERAIFSVTDFSNEISGTFKLWTLEDPTCCASVEGTFKYNPFTFKIIIKHKNVD